MEEEKLFNMLLVNMNANEEEAQKLLKKCLRNKELACFYLKNLDMNYYRNQLLFKAISEEENILDLSENYATNLVACNQLYDRELANWALWFANITTDSTIRNYWRHFINHCHDMLKDNYPNLIGEIPARIKDWIGGWSKEAKFKNLLKINDIYGSRIIIRANNHETPEQLVNTLYYVVKDILELAISEGLSILPADPKKDTKSFNPKEHPYIILPDKKSISILKEYDSYIKDYIAAPKEDGYQSIHAILVHPTYGKMEMQYRTKLMDDYAETGPASHKKYKDLNPIYNFLMRLALEANSKKDHTDFIGLTKSEEFHHRYLRYSPIKQANLPKDLSQLDLNKADLSILENPKTFY